MAIMVSLNCILKLSVGHRIMFDGHSAKYLATHKKIIHVNKDPENKQTKNQIK